MTPTTDQETSKKGPIYKKLPLLSKGAKHRTRRVLRLKRIIIIIAVILFLAVILWPLTDIGKESVRLAMPDYEETDDDSKPTMYSPRLHGVDKNNRPYNIIAKQAVKLDEKRLRLQGPNGDIMMEDGGWYSLQANTALYHTVTKKLDLNGEVNLYVDSGYELNTPSAQLDLESGTAAGKETVHIQGPLGTLDAQGFELRNRGEELFFYGNVKLIAHQGH